MGSVIVALTLSLTAIPPENCKALVLSDPPQETVCVPAMFFSPAPPTLPWHHVRPEWYNPLDREPRTA